MTIEEMRAKKRALGLTNEMIAEGSGVPLGTVQKIFAGVTKAPRKSTLEAIEKMMTEQDGAMAHQEQMEDADSCGGIESMKVSMDGRSRPGGTLYENAAESFRASHMLREDSSAYAMDPKQGHYTIDDYYALPDERRVELIDGWIYDMAAPSLIHQLILSELYLLLAPCVAQHPECEIYFAPLDVRLDNDNRTMVQPDLLIVCNYDDRDIRRINGAPDFIVEILSPSSRYHDMFRKLGKYKSAGVREYWIVDPQKMKVTVYHLEADTLPETYEFSDTVELRISDGECQVDFKKVYARIQKYL